MFQRRIHSLLEADWRDRPAPELRTRGMTQMTATTCGDCGGTMQMGYTADRADYSSMTQAFWVEGEPHMAKFLGMNAGLNVRARARYDIITLRCEQCGLLKSYARPEDRCDRPGE